MNKIILYLALLIIASSCKTASFIIKDNNLGISVRLPSNAKTIKPVDTKDKYSKLFYYPYQDGTVRTWDKSYSMTDSIIIGFSSSNIHVFEKTKRIKELSYGFSTESNGVYVRKELDINGKYFLLYIFNRKENHNDLFVSFYSDFTVKDQIWGVIRFPASYSLDMIEKQTLDILSGIKFNQK